MSDAGYVYLFKTATKNRYKIGFSGNPKRRMKEVDNDPMQENITDFIESFPTQSMRKAEFLLHYMYKKNRVSKHREYFDFDVAEIKQVTLVFQALRTMSLNAHLLAILINYEDLPNVDPDDNVIDLIKNFRHAMLEITNKALVAHIASLEHRILELEQELN